jgi:acyl-CoA synthetase (AMP-forming)/AMP-acid ligase II
LSPEASAAGSNADVPNISVALRRGLADWADQDALAFGGRWRSWRWFERSYQTLDRMIADSGLNDPVPVALIARNRPPHVAAMAAQIAARRTTCMVYSIQSPAAIAADILRLRAPVVMADEEDWGTELRDAVAAIGGIGVILRDAERPFAPHPDLHATGAAAAAEPRSAIAFELLSSGTTGAPKRIPLTWTAVDLMVADAQLAYAGTERRNAPLLMVHPLGNVAGLAYLAPAIVYGQRMVLLEKFDVHQWAEAVRIYRPARGALPPAGLRMVLDARIPRSSLESLTVVGVGGGKLDRDTHAKFEETYQIPVLTAYGATEFGGVIANWTLPLYQEYGKIKVGSVGRASAHVALRVVDRVTFAPLPAGSIGLLEARVPRIGDAWVRTTDLACLDADGFLFMHGRADAAINRGGFKIIPDEVAEVLKTHPAVADAVVVGLPDRRLGEVPVAAVELHRDAPPVTEEALKAFARSKLLAYQSPVAIRIVQALPRNASMKISIPQVRTLFGDPP